MPLQKPKQLLNVSVLLGEQDFPGGVTWAAAVLLGVSRGGREELGWVT